MDGGRNGFENPYPEAGAYTRVECFRSKRNAGRIHVHWEPRKGHEFVLMFDSDAQRDAAFAAIALRFAPGDFRPGYVVFERDDLTITPDMLAGIVPDDVFVGFRPATSESAAAMLHLGFDAEAHRIPNFDGFMMMMPDVLEQMAAPIAPPAARGP